MMVSFSLCRAAQCWRVVFASVLEFRLEYNRKSSAEGPKNQDAESARSLVQAFDERQTQATLDSFLTFSQRFAKIKSKRLQKAVTAISGKKNQEILLEAPEEGAPARKKRKQAATLDPGTQHGAAESRRLSAQSCL